MITTISMVCPFSKRLCRECSFYRGRHHYLCYSRRYQKFEEYSLPTGKKLRFKILPKDIGERGNLDMILVLGCFFWPIFMRFLNY